MITPGPVLLFAKLRAPRCLCNLIQPQCFKLWQQRLGNALCQRLLSGLDEGKPRVRPGGASAGDFSNRLGTKLAHVFDPAQIKEMMTDSMMYSRLQRCSWVMREAPIHDAPS